MSAAAVNEVHVDAAAALAELEAIGARAELDGQAELERQAELEHDAAGHDPQAWSMASTFVVDVFAGQAVPNWELGADDKGKLAGELAAVLDHYFPGGPNGVDNWHPLWRLTFALGTVVVIKGVDWQTGALKPTHKPKPKEAIDGEATERHAPIPGRENSERQEPQRFTLGGG